MKLVRLITRENKEWFIDINPEHITKMMPQNKKTNFGAYIHFNDGNYVSIEMPYEKVVELVTS